MGEMDDVFTDGGLLDETLPRDIADVLGVETYGDLT
jgi:hypothetical protein